MYAQWIESWRTGSADLLHGLDAWWHAAGRQPERDPETDWLGWDGWVRPAGDRRDRPAVTGTKTAGVSSMAQGFLISPDTQSIEAVDVGGLDDIKARIGFETVESDDIGTGGDRLFFDEECFIRGASGRFQVDRLVPVAGKGVVVGTADDGATLTDVRIGLDELRSRTVFS